MHTYIHTAWSFDIDLKYLLQWYCTFAICFIACLCLQWFSMAIFSAKFWWRVVTQPSSWSFSTVTRFITHGPPSPITPVAMCYKKYSRNEKWKRGSNIKFRSLLNLCEVTIYNHSAITLIYILTNQDIFFGVNYYMQLPG